MKIRPLLNARTGKLEPLDFGMVVTADLTCFRSWRRQTKTITTHVNIHPNGYSAGYPTRDEAVVEGSVTDSRIRLPNRLVPYIALLGSLQRAHDYAVTMSGWEEDMANLAQQYELHYTPKKTEETK